MAYCLICGPLLVLYIAAGRAPRGPPKHSPPAAEAAARRPDPAGTEAAAGEGEEAGEASAGEASAGMPAPSGLNG